MDDQKQQLPDEQGAAQSSVGLNPISVIDAVAPTGWRMKLAKATAQLIAGTEKGAIAYGLMRERVDIIEGRSTVSAALANAVAAQAINDPEIMERAKARFLGNAIQEQENIEAVISGTTQYLPLLPAPQDSTPPPLNAGDCETEQQIGDAEANDEPALDVCPLNADWAATFSGLAEQASTQELRDRLSRVLAGELISPGAYSRATIRAIAELERSDLVAVEVVMPYVLGDRLVRTRSEVALPAIHSLLPLSEAGLITDANAMLSWVTKPATNDDVSVFFGGNDWGLIIFMNVGQVLRIPVVPITRTGVAVIDLLGRPDECAVLRRIADELPVEIYSKVLLGRKTGEVDMFESVEQLRPKLTVNMITKVNVRSPFGSPPK